MRLNYKGEVLGSEAVEEVGVRIRILPALFGEIGENYQNGTPATRARFLPLRRARRRRWEAKLVFLVWGAPPSRQATVWAPSRPRIKFHAAVKLR